MEIMDGDRQRETVIVLFMFWVGCLVLPNSTA